jgi:beta-lactam-binding protein with PASTA domain
MKLSNIYSYITRHLLLRNLILAFIFFIIIIFLIFKWLKIYTRHDQAFSVPDLTGLTIKEAQDVLSQKKLKYVLFDSVYVNEFERGTVVDQHPAPGFIVKKNRKIFLTINSVNPEKIIMPDLVNLTLRQALAKLKSCGLRVGEMIYEPDLAINEVLEQKYNGLPIKKGDTLVRNSRIDLVIGKGLSNEKTVVPVIVGYTIQEAQSILASIVLKIGKPTYDSSIFDYEDSMRAIIFKQIPEHNKSQLIPLGSSIDVWLTVDSGKLEYYVSADTLDNEWDD